MKSTYLNSWSWVLEPPHQILTPEGIEAISKRTLAVCGVSSLLSYALANAYLAQPRHPSIQSDAPFGMWLSNVGLAVALFILMIVFIYQLLRIILGTPIPFRTLLLLGAVAIIPLHLTLPLALICHPFRIGGWFIYSLGELAIGVSVLRRMAWGLQAACGWPLWAAGLLVLSPLLIACLGVLFFSVLMLAFLSLAVLGFVVG